MEGSDDSVKVAVNIRPLITSELLNGCTDCVTVTPGEPQIQIGSHVFTYDHVYGSSGAQSCRIFGECVLPLVDALFCGYNATVLAYGQTGSGKTYTMGTNYPGETNAGGIIPKVMEEIFEKVNKHRDNIEFLIRVSFIEIFKEEVFDLLDPHTQTAKSETCQVMRTGPGPNRVPIQIRETALGGITLAGVSEPAVKSKEEMASFLARGSLNRATASTHMNSQSSRSHAIFTICIEQKRTASSSQSDAGDDILISKLHLVDLAGSERAKRTGADGLRLKEGIHINKGLLSLGNVISALGDEKKRKEGAFVPYRDSKLTRLLQDSLGGNSKTVMIACISPADSNAEETINTLKYANRARNIQNKAVINRDPVAAEMQRLRSQLEQLQGELHFASSGGASLEEVQILQEKVSLLELKNQELIHRLKETRRICDDLTQKATAAQVEKDQLILKIEAARGGKPWDEIDDLDNEKDVDLIKSYLSRIQQLEAELRKNKSISSCPRNAFYERLELDKDDISEDLGSVGEVESSNASIEGEDEEKEMEHSSLQDRLDKELKDLDMRLQQKEAEMKQFAKGDTAVLKQHYEKKLMDMEQEKKSLQKEIEDLRCKLSNISSLPDESGKKLKEDYLHKLNTLEAQVSELKKKQETQAQMLRQKQKSDEAARRLQDEIQRIKSQKVQLQQKIKHESEQFRAWKASREKEVLQLKKEGRRNEYEMHKLLALNQRQKMVLQRKTEEAAMATKRLKELLEAKKASSRELANGPGIQHELEVTVRVHEVRSQYERQMQERAAMSKEIARLKEETEMLRKKIMSDYPQTMSPSARSSRISALENMLAASSSTMVSMASQLSEAEERERGFNSKGRWNQIRSLPEAKNMLNFLFNLASSSRCQVRDKEAECREKDLLISELKAKVLRLTNAVRQLEAKSGELQVENMHLNEVLSTRNNEISYFKSKIYVEKTGDVHIEANDGAESENDMEISDVDSDDSDFVACDQADEESDWVSTIKKTRKKNRKVTSVPSRYLFSGTTSRGVKSEISSDGAEETASGQCCTCSKSSFCKTKKCECRFSGAECGSSCGCSASKCANRGFNNNYEEESCSFSDKADEEKKKVNMASQAALLLESAMESGLEAKEEEEKGSKSRKPLGDIGNVKTDQPGEKMKSRKTWHKSKVQIIPTVVGPTITPESISVDNDAPPRSHENIPLRLPRAMSSATLPSENATNTPPLADRNAVRSDDMTSINKDNGGAVVAPRSPAQLRKNANEKENELR
ncbi:chromosome-associated kinesin KIF4 [Carex littledalei]|uniref:Chromosome-associated kinesin KIF4 n=1 Tax=Carex littledalei TaxID=544730 RepID=A0A833VN35_9POAL|nr:chromosome-associated kinesin KIF4 [Carex littledalei]